MRLLALPLLVSLLLPHFPAAADVAPPDGFQVEGISPGARVSKVTPLRIHVSGAKQIISIFVDESPVLISTHETSHLRLDPEQWLAGKAVRTVRLEVRVYTADGKTRAVARTEMELMLARPADAPNQ